MKKQMKKLVLNRETLADLENKLEHVAGAATGAGCSGNCSASCPDICTFSGYRTCNTCGATCGTNLC